MSSLICMSYLGFRSGGAARVSLRHHDAGHPATCRLPVATLHRAMDFASEDIYS